MGVEGIYRDQYEIPSMSAKSLSGQLEDSIRYILIDVRNTDEIEKAAAPWSNTINIPLLMLEKRCIELSQYEKTPIMVLCPTGKRSRQGAKILRLAGFEAYYLEHGMDIINE